MDNQFEGPHHQINNELNLALLRLNDTDEKLKNRYFYSLRKSLIEKSGTLLMSEERKAYLVQQMTTIQTTEELVSLIKEINAGQMNNEDPKLDLLSLSSRMEWEVTSHLQLINEFIRKRAQAKNIDLHDSTIAFVGVIRDSMPEILTLMANDAGKIMAIHHSPINVSLKYQDSIRLILNKIKESNSNSKVVQVIKATWNDQRDLLNYLETEEVKEVFEASADLTRVKEAQVILSGTSTSTRLLSLDMFRPDSVIVDVTDFDSLR